MSLKRILGLLSIIFTTVLFLNQGSISFNSHSSIAYAAGSKVEYLGMVSYSHYTVGKFKVNGYYAFCVDHVKPTPATGSIYSQGSVYSNESIRAILYYGYGGDGNIVGNSDAAYVATSMALDSIMHDSHTSGRSTIPGYDELMERAKEKDAPSTSSSFNKTKASTSISGNEQKSETIKFNADPRNSIKLNIPSGVTLHKGGKDYKNRTVTIKGNESFYFTAGLDYGKDVTFNNIKPTLGAYQSILFVPQNSSLQRLTQGLLTDPQPLKSLTIDFEVRQKEITVQHKDEYNNALLQEQNYKRNIGSDYSFTPKNTIKKGENTYVPVSKSKITGTLGNRDLTLTFWYNLQRTITIKHVDARDNKVLKTETDTKLRGEKYSYGPSTDLKKGDYTYRPLSKDKKTGTVAGKNITLTFYYDTPLIKTGLEKIQVYTAQAKDGLPVNVNLSKVNYYPMANGDMEEAKVNVSLYQGKDKVASNAYTAKALPKSIKFKVPSNKLEVNQKKPYTVKIEGHNKNDIDVISDAAAITTDGYTSSERSFNTSDISFSYTGVIMTEREIKKDMKIYNETLKVNMEELERKITGYGFENPIDVVYTNELGQDFSSKFDFYVPNSILDNTYLTYPKNKDRTIIPFEVTNHKESKKNDILTTTEKLEFPQIKIESITGNLFSMDQVDNKDSRIKYDLVDGGRKFYTPIWGDLGTYQLEVKNVDPLGVHKINLSMKQNLEIYAYMYGHMDSNTGEQDAIYLRPINADDPNYPANWTAEDKRRFEEWNRN